VSRNVLLHYGGSSAERSGLLDRVRSSLKKAGVAFTELGGVKPNPRVSLVREGIKICREKGIDCVLAVGGGSVIDSAKAIGVGVPYSGDVWDFYEPRRAERMLAVGVVLSIPAREGGRARARCYRTRDYAQARSHEQVLRPRFET
jgi:alcohol dehydrogenase YqhD (iron-dependent ADH family)